MNLRTLLERFFPGLAAEGSHAGHRFRSPKSLMLMTLVVVSIGLSSFSGSNTPGSEQLDSAFRRALTVFALARGLNGVISVAQETEIAIQPAGVGLAMKPGEILDPVNDLIERFSWVMLLASSSLGAQKVLLSMSAWSGLLLLLAVAGGTLVLAQGFGLSGPWRQLLLRLFLLLLFLRLLMPAILLLNNWTYNEFLADTYETASESLGEASATIDQINEDVIEQQAEARTAEAAGLVDRARALYRRTFSGMDIEAQLEHYRQAAATISENAISLIVVFLLQSVVFPLLFLWCATALFRRLLGRL